MDLVSGCKDRIDVVLDGCGEERGARRCMDRRARSKKRAGGE